MVRTRKAIYVGNQEVQRRYIGNKLIFELLGEMDDRVKVSGTEIFTDRADNSVVHVEVDGKSYQDGVPTPDTPIEIHSLNDFDVVSSASGKEFDLSNVAIKPELDFYKYTDLIVTDPTKPIYAASSVPNPPLGAVFNNLNIDTKLIARTNIDFPAVHNTALVLIELYKKTNDAEYLNRALLIGEYVLSRGFEAGFYGTMMYLIPNRVSLINGQWQNVVGEINLRTLYQALNLTSLMYEITNDNRFSDAATKLMKTIGNAHNNVNLRITRDGEMDQYMYGASYDLIYVSGGSMTYDWFAFNQSNADVLVESVENYIRVFNNNQMIDWEGTPFTPQDILRNFGQHIKSIYNNGMLTMNPTGLPYNFLDYWSGTVNWDWVGDAGRGDVWFAGDAIFWIIKGIAELGKTDSELKNIAREYRDNFYNLIVTAHPTYADSSKEVLFYDRYTFDGSYLVDDPSLSTSSTALFWMVDEALGITDVDLHNKIKYTLEKHMHKGQGNPNVDGGYGWDAATPNALIEVKATGEIYLSKFIDTFIDFDLDNKLIDKINLLLDEPLRSVGDIKDRLFRDSDGLWKVERNVGEIIVDGSETWASSNSQVFYTTHSAIGHIVASKEGAISNKYKSAQKDGNWNVPQDTVILNTDSNRLYFFTKKEYSSSGVWKDYLKSEFDNNTPVVVQYLVANPILETLDQELQDKLNNLRSFEDSNYVYTLINDKTDISPTIAEDLKPTLHATFKSKAWYDDYQESLLK